MVRVLFILMLGTLLSCLPTSASAEEALALSTTHPFPLERSGTLMIAKSTDFPAPQDIRTWLNKQKPIPAVNLYGGQYWLYNEIRHNSNNRDWAITIDNTLIDRMEVRVYGSDGSVQAFQSGYQHQLDFPLHYGKRVHLAPGLTYRILIHFDSPYFRAHPHFELLPAAKYSQRAMVENLVVIGCMGALLALCLFNLFIWTQDRDRSRLFYSLYLLTYATAWALVFHIPTTLFDFRDLRWHYVPFFLMPILNTLFYVDFLKLKINQPALANWNRINYGLPLLFLPSCFIAPSYAHALATIAITVWLVLALISGITAWRQRFRPARYFILAFVALVIPGLLILPSNIGLPELIDQTQMWALVGGTLDALLLAFALADKITLLSEQKDHYLRQLNDTLELAHTDSLTGLRNRYAFNQMVGQRFRFLANMEDHNQQILILIDLDGLKRINDQYGHNTGDELLKQFAKGLQKLDQHYDASFRLGGDEFAIFSRAPHEPSLREGLATLEQRLIEYGFNEAGISYGLAYSHECATPDALFDCADTRMYLHKTSKKRRREDIAVADVI
ncbi:diguanylate cyclase (GGDEF)-like protein [Chitinivorax tropicus]|uniref:diguanylate cyclase n=1 Tax=Chitinivorax tropicus TaxID=714531 RepID=A0A840MLG2_9PROT|nr:GGDEF domain-containing protein [Chitinivorax tropicus]MBB5017717.1 diguanylate cyclase (GGDEF)-like protein [Chitinivorax tropicus]